MSSPEVLHNARVSFEDSRIAVGAKGEYCGHIKLYESGYIELTEIDVLLPPHQIYRVIRNGDEVDDSQNIVDKSADYWNSKTH